MALSYNQTRFSQALLAKYKKCAPSFTINLYDDHWTLNKGPSKFLYTQPVSGLLDEVRALRIPVDFIEIFDMAHVPYYEGCMIVESIDHRKPRLHLQANSKEPECVRVVLQPNAETFYMDLCLLNAKHGNTWTDRDALELESKILNAVCPPLCLEPDVNLTRIVNTVIRASTSSDSVLMKRKQTHEPEEDENDKAKRAKLWSQYMHPHNGKPSSHTQRRSVFDILHDIVQKDEKGNYKSKHKQPKNEPVLLPAQTQPQSNHTPAPPNAANSGAATSTPSVSVSAPQQEDSKAKLKLKGVKKVDVVEPVAPQNKVKQAPMPSPSVPAPAPSPVPEPRKAATPITIQSTIKPPGDTNATAVAATSPKPPATFQPVPQPSVSPHPPVFPVASPLVPNNQTKKKGVLKKPEEQTAQLTVHQPQPLQTNSMEPQSTWQPSMPPGQYLPPAPKKKQPAQQQGPPFTPHVPVPGFSNNNAFFPNAAYKTPSGAVQNPNMNPNRSSPIAHNQPLLSRDPLPPHSQSPHPAPTQPQQSAGTAAPHQMPHQYNIHLQQARFNPALQGQAGHHSQAMAQHPVPQQHHTQQNVARAAQAQHDPSPAMMHSQMQYNHMAAYSYPHMHMQGMMPPGVRMANMSGAQAAAAAAAGGQYMAAQGWRHPAGRGAGPPMTTIPMHNQQFQQQQQQQQQQQHVLAAMNRVQQAQQVQPQGQGR